MIYVEKANTPTVENNSRKRKAVGLSIAAGVVLSAAWAGYGHMSEPSISNKISNASALSCPTPPCVIIIVGGKQQCVYQNNYSRACP